MDEAARTTEPHPYTPNDSSDCATCGRRWVADVHTPEATREVMNWDLRKAMDELDKARNPEVVWGPSAAPSVVLAQIKAARGYLIDAEKWAVAEMRATGATWQQVGDALGVTAQAAQQRFGGAK